jgi:branched-chain amino acid transport system ATP-binding protein
MQTSSTTADASAGSPEPSGPILEVQDLVLRFGGLTAVDQVSLQVQPGELLAIIGPNGAGKSSLFNCINGVYRPQSGRVMFEGQDITSWSPHRRAGGGIARTFQNLALFDELTVLDNLMAGRNHLMRRGSLAGMVWFGPTQREELAHRARVEEIIDFLDLTNVRHKRVAVLPYGWRKRVEIGRALCMEPRLLLLDEPVAGMNLEETEDVARYLLDVKESGRTSQVLVEHNLGVVMDIADRIIVLDFGQVIADGKPEEVAADPAVMAAYVGERKSKAEGLGLQ